MDTKTTMEHLSDLVKEGKVGAKKKAVAKKMHHKAVNIKLNLPKKKGEWLS